MKRNRHVINKCDLFTYNGKTKSLYDWADELNIRLTTLRSRIHRRMPAEKIFCATRARPGKINLLPMGRIDDGVRQWKFMTMFHFLFGIARKVDRRTFYRNVIDDYDEIKATGGRKEVTRPEYHFDLN